MTTTYRHLLLLIPLLWFAAETGVVGQERPAVRSVRVEASAPSSSDSAHAIEELSKDLTDIIALPKELRSNDVGVRVLSLRTGKELFSLNASKPLTPASTTKLITTYSCLLLFGADYDIPTIAYTESAAVKGVLHGNLYIRGHGDPQFSVNDIDELVEDIKRSGITRIEGDIIGDGTYFDDIYERKDYSGDAEHVVDLPPISGLAIENNMVTVVVSSSRTAGQLCNVQTFPPSSGFTIVNSAKSYAPRRRGSRRKRRGAIERQKTGPNSTPQLNVQRFGDQEYKVVPEDEENAEEAGISISISSDDQGRQIVRVTGRLAVNKTVSKRYEIVNPPLVVAGMFYDRLRTRGIAITGKIRTGPTPATARSVAEFSRPLMSVVEPMMKHSDNHYAEYLFKMIGAAATRGSDGKTSDFSKQAIRQCMEAGSIDFSSCRMNDGSGLSRRNLISADALSSTLLAAYRNPKIFRALYPAMSIAGHDGTLRKRMRGTPAEGNLHGKTGTLRNVSALTGYVTSEDGELLAFAAVMNGYGIGTYKSVQDRIAVRLAEFTYRDGISESNE